MFIRVVTSFARSCNGSSDPTLLCDGWALCECSAGEVVGMGAEVDCEEMEEKSEAWTSGMSEDAFVRCT